MTERLTSGNPIKIILRFSFPMILASILQRLYYMVDIMIAGYYLGDAAIAAAGASTSIMTLLLNVINGLTIGMSIYIAKLYGFGDQTSKQIPTITSALTLFMTLFSVTLAVAGVLVTRVVLAAMNVPGDIIDDAVLYMRLVLLGIPFQTGYSLFSAYLRAVGNSSEAMCAVMISAVINILLDVYLIGYIKMSVDGLALASVFAQFVSCGYLAVKIQKRYPVIKMEKSRFRLDTDIIGVGLRLGIPIAFQQGILPLGSVLSKRAINYFGTAAIAGLTTAYEIDDVAMTPVCNIGAALTTFTAQNRSVGRNDRVRTGFWAASGLSISFALAVGLTFVFFSRQLVGLFSVTEETAVYAQKLLLTCSMFYAVFALEYACAGLLQGFEVIGITVIGNVIAFVCRLGSLYSLYRVIGFVAVPISEIVGWTSATLIYLFRCARKDINVFGGQREK